MVSERPGTSNLRMNAVATAAICSRSDTEISSAGKARASPPEPQNGMARVEADRMRCMANLLVIGGMKISGEYLVRLSISQHRKQRRNIAMRSGRVKRRRCDAGELGVGYPGWGRLDAGPAKLGEGGEYRWRY